MIKTNETYIIGNYYIGRLATPSEMPSQQDPIFDNQTRFKVNIKILSVIPEKVDLAHTSNIITGLESRIRPQYNSETNPAYAKLSKIEKRKQIQSDLSKSLVIFKLEKRDLYYNLISSSIKKRNEPYNLEERYDTIPYFKVSYVDRFIDKLKRGETISDLRGILENRYFDEGFFESDYVPPYIIIHDSEDEVFTYGPINKIKRNDNGTSFVFADHVDKYKMNDEDFLYNNYNNLGDEESDNITKLTCYFINTISSDKIREKMKAHEKQKEEATVLFKNETSKVKIVVEKEKEQTPAIQMEQKIMERFKESAESKGLYFDDLDLYNFHTAMKTGNMVILAGMSGTGKSKIVDCYGEALGLKENGRLLKIPVRPFWQDDSDLLGYLDVLNNIYRPGDSGLIDFLKEAKDKPDDMFIVCFDEMNLARVEHYFSQFLSVLENDENERKILLYNKEYEGKLYNSHQYKSAIKIGSNVLFVGTVNLDESTYQFSDKVLDRANVIHLKLRDFSEVYRDALNYKATDGIETAIYKKNDYFGTRPDSFGDNKFFVTENEISFLWDLHRALKESNDKLGIGFRIVRQIDRYLQCLPDNGKLTRKIAFDLQILQRVLTKVRGSEEQLTNLIGIYDQSSKEPRNSQLIEMFKKNTLLSDFTESRLKVSSLAKELSIYGHTL